MTEGIMCHICPRACRIPLNEKGFCGARINRQGVVVAENYGKVTAIALDPIEKKPLKRFFGGSKILSVGSYGCNLRCPFCQNYRISMDEKLAEYIELSPEKLVNEAVNLIPEGNIGIAYTYNEPLIGYEYVMDTAILAGKKDLVNVVVSNGYINEEPLLGLLDCIDAFNIDLKGFTEGFYKRIGGNLEVVKRSISLVSSKCHVEVTTLIIPGENDSEEEMAELSSWLASVNPEIPLHISRFFPAYKMHNKEATPVAAIKRLGEIAGESLRYVFLGNVG